MNKLYIYTEDDVTPKVVDTIKGIIADKFPGEDIRFKGYDPATDYDAEAVLVLGKITNTDYMPTKTRLEFTYSIPQIMTKANAATVLAAGVQRTLRKTEPVNVQIARSTVSGRGGITQGYLVDLFDFTKPVAIDIETSGNLGKTHTPEEVGLISVAIYQPGVGALVLVNPPLDGKLVDFSENEAARIGEFLDKFECAIYHNGKFDIRVLNRVCGVKLHNWFDTMLAHHVLNQAAGQHGLKDLAKLYFGADDWEAGIGKYLKGGGHYENIPREYLIIYNGYDVYWTYRLFELLDPLIDADDNAQKAFVLEMAEAEFLLKVERRGIPFDNEYAEWLAGECESQAKFYQANLRVLTGVDTFNPGSWQQVKKALAVYGVDTPSTDEKHIAAIQADAEEGSDLWKFCSYLISYRKATKMRGTYAEGWAAHSRNGRVHPTFLVHGTSTGRLSSTGPNAQNVPREKRIRKMVTLNGEN